MKARGNKKYEVTSNVQSILTSKLIKKYAKNIDE